MVSEASTCPELLGLLLLPLVRLFSFFQAEDGIRDWSVTGVQTCALPISRLSGLGHLSGGRPICALDQKALQARQFPNDDPRSQQKIGRASCRERVEV